MRILTEKPKTAEELYKKISTQNLTREEFRKAWITEIEQMEECSEEEL